MGYVTRKVEVFEKTGDTWSTTGTAIPEAFSVSIKKGAGKIKNTFSFKVPNGKGYFARTDNPFVNEALVDIYIKADGTTYEAADKQIRGTIRALNQSIDDGGNVIMVKGNDFVETFFDTQMPVNQENKNWTELVQTVLTELSGFNPSKTILWASKANKYVGEYNPSTKNDGTNFPKKNLILNFTRVSEMIEKLTSNEFTEDGQYIYWIEEQSGTFFLVCRFKGSTTTGTITEGDGTFQTKITKKKEDIKNFVIFNCGNDLYGIAVEGMKYDTSSIGNYGMKTYYATEQTGSLFKDILEEERFSPAKKNLFNPDSDGNPQDESPVSYNYTFQISGTTVSDKKGFNDELVRLALNAGRDFATSIINQSSKPQYKVEINKRFTNSFNVGEQWQCIFPSRNLSRPLRIDEIHQSVNETSLILVEDEAKATID